MNIKDAIRTLEHIAIYLEIKGENAFKIAAYRKAAQALETEQRTLAEIDNPATLNGIGKATAEVIIELKEAGQSSLLEQLKAELPSGLIALLSLPGLGGKKIGKLYRELGVTDIETLKQACIEEKVQQLSGFGKKTEEKILAAIQEVGTRPERLALPFVIPVIEQVEAALASIDSIKRFSRAGSFRRLREDVKDLDFIIATLTPKQVKEQLLSLPFISNVIASGDTKVSVEVSGTYPVSIDFRLVSEEEFATTLHHFTGSKDHNVKMRQLAKKRGEKISEYGVENIETGELHTFSTEQDFFAHFQLEYIPPEAREDQGEIEKAQAGKLTYLQDEDIRGDLHMHSTWSDGANSIEEMVESARQMGYSYIAITDHSKFLRVANGLTVERLKEQHARIRHLNKQYDDITILTGIEMDILPDGTLDYEDDILAEIDLVIASIHSSFQQDEHTIMERLKTALYNPHVDIIAHPTGRVLGRRKGYNVNVEHLIQLAKETNTALELNASPYRLDLSARWLKRADEEGVNVVINTDAHRVEGLSEMSFGTGTARKAMLSPKSVINTWTLEELTAFLKRHD
ncbi:DNA polymerase/3'-5' exonuclease PolX [Halalkalibacter hemicellulosilyticus]|uniref:DNA-directed DNA polymerase n=1 Tax=Halalkalibacter hemicellulosilyticusJCM 9152 TaxID=1236971 RepID=W4QEQ6_9BACI|nr:DNA polymerase/3'-5' exonuclease PolX [Halalkalibacter hemicellulosilyticus]GAE30153.1 DNA polymerase X family [Halalkalibacter hemicellulosilyticusJCM 9152]